MCSQIRCKRSSKMKKNIPVCTAKLSVNETEKFLKDFEELEIGRDGICHVVIQPDPRIKHLMSIKPKEVCKIFIFVPSESIEYLVRSSFEDGLLHHWGWDKKFKLHKKQKH